MKPEQVAALRTAAAVAVIVLAVLSRGDALVLAALVVLAAWRPAALVVVPALVAASWRWGSSSLEALAGAQSVLGPAGFVGPATAAIGTWMAGVALLFAIPRTSDLVQGRATVVAVAIGTAAAAVVAGPGMGGALWVRGVAIVVASLGATGVARLRARGGPADVILDGVALVCGVGALVVVFPAAPGWSGTIEGAALREGVALAVAALALVGVGGTVIAAMRERAA